MQQAWQETGIVVLLLVLIPLMVHDAHDEIRRASATARSLLIALSVAAVAFSAIATPVRGAADDAVLAGAGVFAVWSAVLWSGVFTGSNAFNLYAVVAFSVLTIVISVSLIRSAFLSNRRADLYLGVLFALAFIVVRWTDLIENMMWSGLMLLLTGGGLLAIAWFWRHRDRGLVEGATS